MESRYAETMSVAEQAAEWLHVMKTAGHKERAEFWSWMASSPMHVKEMLLAAQLDQELNSLDPARAIDVQALIAGASSNVVPLSEEPVSTRVKSKHWYHHPWRIGAAACMCMVIIGAATYFATETRDTYSTKLGQQLVFELKDGSVVHLNTLSHLKVRYTDQARDIYLPEGQALFYVSHDALRPFRVHAASSVIQAIGTQFDVRVMADRTMVSVVEGTVQISSNESGVYTTSSVIAPEKISAGEGASIDSVGRIKRSASIDSRAITAWSQQRLVFSGETLEWIVGEFNRYNSLRLRVEGDALAARRFNGVFDAHSPESLLTYLAEDDSLSFERDGDLVVIRERVSSNHSTVP